MGKDAIIEWVTDANTCFLIGTGCSCCANKPMINQLTSKVLEKLGTDEKDLFAKLEGNNGRKTTIEDLLNQLIQMRKVISSRKEKNEGNWNIDKIDMSIKTILENIVHEIDGKWGSSQAHEKFIKRILKNPGKRIYDIFTLNYDIVFEATFEKLGVPYIDGFMGAENAFFDSNLLESINEGNSFFRLHKLHGSINWVRDQEGIVRRKPCGQCASGDRQVIYPSEQKYYQTQYGIYEVLMNLFRKRLKEKRPNNKLVILGYSFADDHINEIIIDACKEAGTNLTIYALLGEEEKPDEQIVRLKELITKCNNQLNIMVGNKEFLGTALEQDEWASIKANDYWKFENLVQLLTAGESL